VANQVVDGILSMALQLPAVQKLGEEIGINIGNGIARTTGHAFETRAGDSPNPSSAGNN
jgi:flotillin